MQGIWFFIIYIASLLGIFILFAILAVRIWRLTDKQWQKHQRELFQKRYPYLNADEFTPVITISSPCCKTIMWEHRVTFYFCDNCGQRYKEEYDHFEKKSTGELQYLEHDRDLSALNELYKSWVI